MIGKKCLAFASYALCLGSYVYGGDTLRNGGFEDGKKGWKGDGRVEVIDGSSVLAVKTRRKGETFSQDIRIRRADEITLKFRYKFSEDYENSENYAFNVRIEIKGYDYVYRPYAVRADGEWHTATWNFDELDGINKPKLSVVTYEAKGSIYFDDFVVIEE